MLLPPLPALLVATVLALAMAAWPVRAAADESNVLPIEVEVVGDIAAPLLAVRAVLLDLEGFPRWYPATKEFRVLDRPAADSALVYGVQALPWPVGDRDYVVEYRWYEESDAFVLLATARVAADPASPAGVVRVERITDTPHDYFRFITACLAAEICRVFADVVDQLPEVNLHCDAHVEQYTVTNLGRGLSDFDDCTRGKAVIDPPLGTFGEDETSGADDD